MSVLADLVKEESEHFEKLLSEYVANEDDAETVASLTSIVDEHGLKSPKTMRAVGTMQKDGKLKPGLYKELVALLGRVTERKDKAEGASPTSEKSENKEDTVSEETKAEVAEATEENADNVVEINKLSDKDEAKIKERMAKEEEKLRKRLAEKEKKVRQRLLERDERRAQRQGMKLETIQAIKERQAKIKANSDEMKKYREENKKLRAEIKELRPKRKKKKEKEEAKAS